MTLEIKLHEKTSEKIFSLFPQITAPDSRKTFLEKYSLTNFFHPEFLTELRFHQLLMTWLEKPETKVFFYLKYPTFPKKADDIRVIYCEQKDAITLTEDTQYFELPQITQETFKKWYDESLYVTIRLNRIQLRVCFYLSNNPHQEQKLTDYMISKLGRAAVLIPSQCDYRSDPNFPPSNTPFLLSYSSATKAEGPHIDSKNRFKKPLLTLDFPKEHLEGIEELINRWKESLRASLKVACEDLGLVFPAYDIKKDIFAQPRDYVNVINKIEFDSLENLMVFCNIVIDSLKKFREEKPDFKNAKQKLIENGYITDEQYDVQRVEASDSFFSGVNEVIWRPTVWASSSSQQTGDPHTTSSTNNPGPSGK